jgi:HSP20 family protein
MLARVPVTKVLGLLRVKRTWRARCPTDTVDKLVIPTFPFKDLAGLERALSRLFSEVFTRPGDGNVAEPAYFRLPVDVQLKEGSYVITAPLAGFKPEEVEVNLDDGVLTVSPKQTKENNAEPHGYGRQEVVSGIFYRKVPVGRIDSSSVTAKVENGVLTVTLPAKAFA